MKKNSLVKIALSAAVACLIATSTHAEESKPKRELKNNMMEVYNLLPDEAKSFNDVFTNGMFYGRLRMNSFLWDWKSPDTASNADHYALAVGGSLIYKTAPLYGISATTGFYYADNAFPAARVDNADVGVVKAGKDTFSRYDVKTSGTWNMAVLAQAYIQYDISKTSAKIGRQIFESFLTKSNDTKMIPNTFEGASIEIKEIPDTKLRAAYFYAQKLRDHTTFHDVITYGDSYEANSTNGGTWNNNDDSGVHQGLSYKNFVDAGKKVNHELIIIDASNKSIKDLKVDLTYALVPEVLSSFTGEINYDIKIDSFTLTPGIRYMQQMDNGGGVVGGSGLSGTITAANATSKGYKVGDSLNSSLAMARLALKNGPLKAQIAYSAVADEADIVAPWRGFPTGGYTRAMGQYNWRANTKTTAAEIFYDFEKAKLIPGFSALARYAMQDFDEAKQAGGVQADSNILHLDLKEQISEGLDAKIRIGLVSANERADGSGDKESNNEYRFELNYLF